jgi:hypothetical protein
MAKASRRIKTLTINKSRDIVVDRLLKNCQDGAHQKCTGWAVLKKDISPIDANYFLKCTCACHHKKAKAQVRKVKPKKSVVAKRVKKKAKGKAKRKQKHVKRSKKKSRKTRKR